MAIRTRIIVPLIICAALAAAVYYGSHASVTPAPSLRSALAPHYMGQAAVALPGDFIVKSGRLAVTCPGRPGTTSVIEAPHQNYGLVVYEALSIMLPTGGPSRIMKDLTLDFGRPAQLVFTTLNQEETEVSVIADLGTGSVRLSRVTNSRGALGFSFMFTEEARKFFANYSWGHRGNRPTDIHSLYGYMGRQTPCANAAVNLVFASKDEAVKIFLSTADDVASGAQVRGLELAAGEAPSEPPSWLSETLKIFKGQWNRKIQGGSRLLAGRPGTEWVAIRRDLSSGRVMFTAQWLPEKTENQSPMPAIIMNAALNEAPMALRLWNDILSSSTLAMDFYL